MKTRKSRTAESQKAPAHIVFQNPDAREVFIAGSFNQWQPRATEMVRGKDGQWAVDLRLQPGRYEYRMIVDGVWTDDPSAKGFVPNAHGSRNGLLFVGEQQASEQGLRAEL